MIFKEPYTDISRHYQPIIILLCSHFPPPLKPGYHVSQIPKGELGSSSKLLEEVLELIDAEKQECKIMALVELSDLIGAIHLYLENHAPGVSVSDLERFSSITRRAFENGHRT